MYKGAKVQIRCHYTVFTKCGTHGSPGFVIWHLHINYVIKWFVLMLPLLRNITFHYEEMIQYQTREAEIEGMCTLTARMFSNKIKNFWEYFRASLKRLQHWLKTGDWEIHRYQSVSISQYPSVSGAEPQMVNLWAAYLVSECRIAEVISWETWPRNQIIASKASQ